ncbi:MAG: DUF6364 family protein [Crocinitomicaceae bacterium]|nr:hypothetical protein [Crocinitomicaceae bacterium]
MDKPLNLKLDDQIIEFAKNYAKSKGLSLSKYLEKHFRDLIQEEINDKNYLKKYGISEEEYNEFRENYVDSYGIKEGSEKEFLKKRLRKKHS